MREKKPRRIKTSRRRTKSTRPSRKELKSIYNGVLSGSDEVRAQSLSAALEWYDNSKDWLEKDKKRFPQIDRANVRKYLLEMATWRQRANNVRHNLTENEKALRKALEYYEKALLKILRTKPVLYYYRKLEKVRSKLQEKQKRLTSRYELLFNTLWEAMRPVSKLSNGALGYTVQDPPKEVSDGHTRWFTKDYRALNHRKELAAQLLQTYRKEGWLAVILDELPTLALAAVGEYDKESNRLIVTPAMALKQTEFVIKMMHNVLNYARKDQQFARRLIRAKRKTRKTKKRRIK